MKNSAYWQERFKLLEQSQNQRGMQCYADIEKQYRQAQKQLKVRLPRGISGLHQITV